MKPQRRPAEAAAYGSTPPVRVRKKKPSPYDFVEDLANSSPRGLFAVVLCFSVGTFFVLSLFFTFLLFNRIVWAVGFFMLAEFTFLVQVAGGSWSTFKTPVSIACAVAALLGTCVGSLIYDLVGYFAFIYARSRMYENVVPHERAAAVADAGGIVFATEAHVDRAMSAGFVAADGSMYCAAPVRGIDNASEVEFWAVGVDCCSSLGHFDCDSAGDSSAHGARVVFHEGGFFRKSYIENYQRASEKVEATHGLMPNFHPLYVHWIPDEAVSKMVGGYVSSACGYIFLATFIATILAAPFLWLFSLYWHQHYMPVEYAEL